MQKRLLIGLGSLILVFAGIWGVHSIYRYYVPYNPHWKLKISTGSKGGTFNRVGARLANVLQSASGEYFEEVVAQEST
ncbi:MAG: hypothetical protein P1V97_38100, partial [Planctomycetota bacterium]|nr:hypothetical protein [Planctomycetota bacterium]